ncbi:MAG: DUF4141 domain-containing protein [Bacteroides sp.]|nr:DUF4141 domain-containing protein [Bacteroides sp.]
MKQKLIILGCMLSMAICTHAQWVVTDPSNLAQSIVNTTKQIVETSSTAKSTLANFQETVKIFEQSKQYYDALKSVNNLVKDARKVQQRALMVSEIGGIYVQNFQKMLSDPNYAPQELDAIASGYTALLQESTNVLEDLRLIINPSTLSMSDKERMEIIDSCYQSIREHRQLAVYYTNKMIGISYLRAKEKGDIGMVLALYGSPNEKYW